ncbi:hypothetical protein JMUB7524_20150 [Staphylococcus aureus]
MKKLQLKKWKCRENDIEAVHNNKGYAYQRKLDKLEEVRKSYYPIKRAIDLILSLSLLFLTCLLYTSPSPRDMRRSRMPSSA